MEMNRYLIAALYVMAGCAVTIPLKAQSNGELLRGERCRLIITNTVKVISVYLEQEEEVQDSCNLPPDYSFFPNIGFAQKNHIFERTIRIHSGSLCRTSHKIRAPEAGIK